MISLGVFLVVAAVVCWILATFNIGGTKYNLIAAGLALCGIAYVFTSVVRLG